MNTAMRRWRRINGTPRHALLTTVLTLLVIVGFAGFRTLNIRATGAQIAGTHVLIPTDQPATGALQSGPFVKPHEIAVDEARGLFVTSNERQGCAGITIFQSATNVAVSSTIIDEPGLQYVGGPGEGGPSCNDSTISTSPPVSQADVNFPAEVRMNPSVCLPVALPTGADRPALDGIPAKIAENGGVCAPLGAERQARQPHGISMRDMTAEILHSDDGRVLLYQVLEHSGLQWSANRSEFEVALSTDTEAGLLVEYDVTDPLAPKISKGFLLGYGARELAVNPANGLVFVGNYKNMPGANTPIWMSVIDPAVEEGVNPYGFIDLGYDNPIHGIGVDTSGMTVYGVTHVSEKLFAFDGACKPTKNAEPTIDKVFGDNCVLYWAGIRQPFMAQVPEGVALLAGGKTIHMDDLVVGSDAVYATVHSIHVPEYTGRPSMLTPREGKDFETPDIMGRWVARLMLPKAAASLANPTTKELTANVAIMDVSNGVSGVEYPQAVDIGFADVTRTFVQAHRLGLDEKRGLLYVTGGHTGNLGVIDLATRKLRQVVPISMQIPGWYEGYEDGIEVPHVQGVQVDTRTGVVYVTDAGADCWYEAVRIFSPRPQRLEILAVTTDRTAPQEVNTPVQFAATAIGGSGSLEFKWFVFDGTAWSIAKAWSTANTFTWTPEAVSSAYRVGVWVRTVGTGSDAPETGAAVYSMAYPIIAAQPLTVTDVVPDIPAPRQPGMTTTFTPQMLNEKGPCEYKWFLYDGAAWTVLQTWSPIESLTWTPDTANPAYRIGVWARPVGSTVDAPVTSTAAFSIHYPIVDTDLPLIMTGIVSDRPSPQVTGTKVTFKAAVVNGKNTEFKWFLFDGTVWKMAQDWSLASTFVWTPVAANPGYRIGAWVRVAGSTDDAPASVRAMASTAFAINPAKPLTVTTILPDVVMPMPVDLPIRFRAVVAGATGALEFKWFEYDGTQWMIAQDWSSAAEHVFTATVESAQHRVGVWVRTAGSTDDRPATSSAVYSLAAPVVGGGQ